MMSVEGLLGRCVKLVSWDEAAGDRVAQCRRDARFVPVKYCTGARDTVNRRLRRRVRDLPLWGRPVTLDPGLRTSPISAPGRPG